MYSGSPSHESFLNDASVVTSSVDPLVEATVEPSPLSMPVRISGPLVSRAMATSRPSSGVSSTDWRVGHHRPVVLVRTVREVHPCHVEPRLAAASSACPGLGLRADRADDDGEQRCWAATRLRDRSVEQQRRGGSDGLHGDASAVRRKPASSAARCPSAFRHGSGRVKCPQYGPLECPSSRKLIEGLCRVTAPPSSALICVMSWPTISHAEVGKRRLPRRPAVGERDRVALLDEPFALSEGDRVREAALDVVGAVGGLRVRVEVRDAAAVEVERRADVGVAGEDEDRAARAVLGDEARRGAGRGERDDQLRKVRRRRVDDRLRDRLKRGHRAPASTSSCRRDSCL